MLSVSATPRHGARWSSPSRSASERLSTSSVVAFTIIKFGGCRVSCLARSAGHPAPARPRADGAARSCIVAEALARGVHRRVHKPQDDRVLPRRAAAVRHPGGGRAVGSDCCCSVACSSRSRSSADSVWAYAAGTARAWFARSPRRLSTLSGVGGGLLIGLGGHARVHRPQQLTSAAEDDRCLDVRLPCGARLVAELCGAPLSRGRRAPSSSRRACIACAGSNPPGLKIS